MTLKIRLPFLIGVLAVVACFFGCGKNQGAGEPANDRASSPEGGTAEIALLHNNWQPSSAHERIDELTFGETLDDVVRNLGQWDKVGDVMGDDKGQFYPFSDRDGYNYLVRVGENSMINGVWRREGAKVLRANSLLDE